MKKTFLPLGIAFILATFLLSGCSDAKSFAPFKFLKSSPSLGEDNKKEEKAFQQYLARAVQNDTEAMSKLGDCYLYCLGTEGSLKEAYKWYLLASKAGDIHATYMLAYCYYAGFGVKSDTEKAIMYCDLAARSGSLAATAKMPEFGTFGRFKTVKNNIELFAMSSRLPENRDAEQEFYLGLCYFNGKGTKQNVQKGLELMNNAAKRGSWKANFELASIYCYSKNVTKNEKKALNYAKKAAKQIGAYGVYNLAGYERYLKHLEDLRNLDKITEDDELEEFNNKIDKIIARFDNPADISFLEDIKDTENEKYKEYTKKRAKKPAKDAYIESYEQAANAGFAPAQYEMGNIETVKGNTNAGFEWYSKAAEKGLTKAEYKLQGEGYKDYLTLVANYDVEAQFKLGVILLNEYRAEEQKDGFEFVNLAMENGHPEARFVLAECYFYGKGTPEDKGKAYYFYKAEADLGRAEAQYMVGEYYWYGYATTRKDMISAYGWYFKAAEQKHPKALAKAGICCFIGYGTSINYTKAFEFLKESDDLGEDLGYYCLGLCYEAGLGVEKSKKRAFDYYSLSESKIKASKFKVALCYIDGVGVPKDRAKGLDTLRSMARNDYIPAKLALGDINMEDGNYRTAFDWYKDALDTSSYANYRIGECYQLGRGVDKSIRQAATYYKQAYDMAQKNIGQWEDDASDHYCLALCYENGRGTDKDLDKALEQYRLVAAESYADAADKVKSLQSRVNQQQAQ